MISPIPQINTDYQKHLEGIIAVLVTKFAPQGIRLTDEEIEYAPDIEVQNLFETHEIEMRASTWKKDPPQ